MVGRYSWNITYFTWLWIFILTHWSIFARFIIDSVRKWVNPGWKSCESCVKTFVNRHRWIGILLIIPYDFQPGFCSFFLFFKYKILSALEACTVYTGDNVNVKKHMQSQTWNSLQKPIFSWCQMYWLQGCKQFTSYIFAEGLGTKLKIFTGCRITKAKLWIHWYHKDN